MIDYSLTVKTMNDYQHNYLSEFEREFELDSESTEGVNEFETLNDEFESDMEVDGEYDGEGGFDMTNEADYLSEFEADNELEPSNEFEFENTPEGRYEARLYEIFTNNYENEFEFENDFNQVMHEVERDFFWGTIKKWGRKLAPLAKMALKAVPGGGNLMSAIQQITKDPRGLLKTLAMKFGPQALNAVFPGAGVALGAVLGNSEMDPNEAARQAASDTVALAKEAYTNFADEISRMTLSRTMPQVRTQLDQAARNSFRKAQQTVRLGSYRRSYKRIRRQVKDVKNGAYKVVTIVYKRT
jgi:hypothetical protein